MIDPLHLAAFLAPVHTVGYKVEVMWNGSDWTDETAYVTSANGVETYEPATRQRHPTEVNIELDNADGRYDAEHADGPLVAYLGSTGQKVRISAGYGGYLTPICTGLIDKLEPDEGSRTATMRVLDRSARLADAKTSYGPVRDVVLDDILRAYLTSAGLVEGTDFILDEAETTARYAYVKEAPILPELSAMMVAENGRIWVDPEGVLRFANQTNHREKLFTALLTIRRSELVYDLVRKHGNDRPINRLVVTYSDRQTAGSTSTIFTLQEPITIPAAVQVGTAYAPGEMAFTANGPVNFHVASWEPGTMELRNVPEKQPFTEGTVDTFTVPGMVVHVGECPAMSGFSDDVYYTVSWLNSSEAYFTVRNCHETAVSITALILKAKPDTTVAEYSVVVEDLDSQAKVGVQSQAVSGQYFPDTATARSRLVDHLFTLSGDWSTLDIPQIDGLPWVHAQDSIYVIDDQYTDVAYWLIVAKHTWSLQPDSYTSAIEAIPGLPASQLLLYSEAPYPTESFGSATYSGQEYWGTVTNDIHWGQGTWN